MTGLAGARKWLADALRAGARGARPPAWVQAFRFARLVVQHFTRDACTVRAAGMDYSSLLALVPALVVAFAFLASFGTLRELADRAKTSIFAYVLPTAGDQITRYLDSFIENAKAVNAIGLAGLLVTTILLFYAIEDAFNAVLHVRERRPFLRQVATFTSFLIWGPVLIGASFAVSGKLRAVFSHHHLDFAARLIFLVIPYVLTTAAMVLAFSLIPAARVRFSAALLGGAVAGVGWEVAKVGFAYYAARIVNYSRVYGSLSVIPIFLIWLYVTWLIVLFGLETTYVRQNFAALLAKDIPEPRGRERLRLGLRAFGEVARAHDEGRPPLEPGALALGLGVPFEIVTDVLHGLAEKGIVVGAGAGYVPARPPDRLTVRDVFRALFDEERLLSLAPEDGLARRLDETLARYEGGAEASIDRLTFADVLREGDGK